MLGGGGAAGGAGGGAGGGGLEGGGENGISSTSNRAYGIWIQFDVVCGLRAGFKRHGVKVPSLGITPSTTNPNVTVTSPSWTVPQGPFSLSMVLDANAHPKSVSVTNATVNPSSTPAPEKVMVVGSLVVVVVGVKVTRGGEGGGGWLGGEGGGLGGGEGGGGAAGGGEGGGALTTKSHSLAGLKASLPSRGLGGNLLTEHIL